MTTKNTTQKLTQSTLVSLLAGAPIANAALVYNTNTYSAGIGEAILWDIDGNTTAVVPVSTSSGIPNFTTLVSSHPGANGVLYNGSYVYMLGGQALGATGGQAAYANVTFATTTTCSCGIPNVVKLLMGDNVSTSNFSASSAGFGYFYPGNFTFDQSQYFGFAFSPDGINLHYGWAQIKLDSINIEVILEGWAYETTPGQGVTVGPIPEPETAALGLAGLAAGAAGLRRWRNKRKAA